MAQAVIGFTGTRTGMTDEQKARVEELLREERARKDRNGLPLTVMHGDCVGADADFDDIAARLGYLRYVRPCTIHSMRAWCTERGAIEVATPEMPMARNRKIVGDVIFMIACPSTYAEIARSGTWATIRQARRTRCSVQIVYPNGRVEQE